MSDEHAAAPEQQAEVLTEEDVFEALEEVIDPELGLDFVSLGLVYDVEIEKEDVYVTFTLTTPACPIGPQVSEQMKEFVGDLPGVSRRPPEDGLRPRLVTRDDDRGRQVRTWLLGTDCGVIRGHRGSVSTPPVPTPYPPA